MASCHGAYSDGVLRVICAGSPPVVPIAGEIDESSYSGLVSTLEGLADREGDVHVNLAEVAFFDLAGLRAVLWLASRKLPLRARRRPSVVCAARTLPRAGSQRRVPERPVTYFLKASLTFSPAFLRSPLVWSACPSASRDSFPVALPAPSLTLPLAFSAVFLILSSALIFTAFHSCQHGLSRKSSVALAVQPTNFAVQLPGSGATGPSYGPGRRE